MANLASGVTVVTTELKGASHGMTATSFNSVSLDPMLVQVSLDRESRTHRAVGKSGKFAVNLLAEDQAEIARLFAEPNRERFHRVRVREGSTGVPLILGAVGTLECNVTEELAGGDHTIFVGEVVACSVEDRLPLLHFRSQYYRLEDKEPL